MVPAQHFDKPGKSPMGMEMVPRYSEGGASVGESAGIVIDPGAQQNLGIRLATVRRGDLASTVDAAGVIDFNQRNVAIVQARSAGFVQRVYGRAPGDVVRAGAPIADLLIPAWGGAQGEFLAVKRFGDPALIAAARQRLRLLGMPDVLIASVGERQAAHRQAAISTPLAAIQTLEVRQGMSVSAGETLAQVSGLSTVWLNAAVPEAQAGMVRVGETARVDLAAFPGETFTGRVTAILPTAQADSLTPAVRVELPNPGAGFGGDVRHRPPGRSGRLGPPGPSEAVIRTGRRNLDQASPGAVAASSRSEIGVGPRSGRRRRSWPV